MSDSKTADRPSAFNPPSPRITDERRNGPSITVGRELTEPLDFLIFWLLIVKCIALWEAESPACPTTERQSVLDNINVKMRRGGWVVVVDASVPRVTGGGGGQIIFVVQVHVITAWIDF